MEERSLNIISKFTVHALVFSLIALYFISDEGYLVGTHLTFLTWSFYVLCIPAKHGSISINFIYKKITGKNLAYPPIYVWFGAIILNVFSVFLTPIHYLKHISTYLLYRIIVTPWPHWMILITTAIATFFPFWVNLKPSRRNKLSNKIIQKFLILLAVAIFAYLAMTDFIIILNLRI